MNKIFKVIWNRASQSWTVVSELGKAQGKAKVTSTKQQVILLIFLK
ncbi:autotransporter adhesin [Actinobacillus equuli]|nr:autotransporter adhesin [Actinobacillus equuli]